MKGMRMSYTEPVSIYEGAGRAVDMLDHTSPDASVDEFGVFASTTEALTLTILTELVRRASLQSEVPSSVSEIVGGVYAAERDHWLFISKLYDPSTTKFWIPDAFFGGAGDAVDLTAVGQAVAAGEHLFVNTYLVGVTTCAAAGRPNLARYSAELAAVESEHRLLGQTLAGVSPPTSSTSWRPAWTSRRPSTRRTRRRSRA